MTRDLRGLADTTVDLVVVGAGIYGALAAWDAASRGLTVALIDRGDFGGATSANSMRTLHGGLRSLQSLNLAQMRLFIRERRAFATMAPHLVEPLPFCVPTSWHPTRNALAVRLALAVTDAVGWDRHDGIDDPALRLPSGRVVGRAECLRLNPIIAADGVTGGAVWYDYQMRQAERLLMAVVRSAADAGAIVANYVEAVGLVVEAGRVAALQVRDLAPAAEGGFEVRTRAVVNATGPWASAVVTSLTRGAGTGPTPRLSRAMNLVVPRITDRHACGGFVDGRAVLAVPWGDVTIVGTSHDPHEGDADAPHGTPEHVATLLREAQLAFPRAGLGPGVIRTVHRGLLPMLGSSGARVRLLKESAVIDHAGDGVTGLVSIFSVRYTTAGLTARQAVDVASRSLDRPALPRPTRWRTSAAAFGTVDGLIGEARGTEVAGTAADGRERLARTYGSHWREVAAMIVDPRRDAMALSAGCRVSRAEVAYAVRHEQALTLADVLLRRTSAATAGHPGPEAVAAAALIMQGLLGWTAGRLTAECGAFDRLFPAS